MNPTLVDLTPYYGILRVWGPDAFAFLQGQLTCDMREITSTELKLGGHCNLKGRLRALYRLFKKDDVFYLELPLPVLKSGMSHLKKYAQFSKVTIADDSEQWHIYESIDPTSQHTASPHFPKDEDLIHLTLSYAPHRFQILRSKSSPIKEHPIELQLSNAITSPIASPHLKFSDFQTWKLTCIREGIPEVWPETVEQLLPHHINLPQLGGVSFTKGCYCGQEIVARMEYRGNIKRTLTHITLSNHSPVPIPGKVLHNKDSEELGIVVTASSTPEGQVEILLIANK